MLKKPQKVIPLLLKFIILGFFVVITLYPVFWMISGSLKTTSEFYQNIWGFPSSFAFQNYVDAWERGQLGSKYLNSILTTGLFLAIVIPVNSCAAYVISRMRFKGRAFIATLPMRKMAPWESFGVLLWVPKATGRSRVTVPEVPSAAAGRAA